MTARIIFRQSANWAALLVLGTFLLLFIFKNVLFNFYLHKKIASFNQSHHVTLVIGKAKLTGISSVLLSEIIVKPDSADTLIKVGTLYASLNPLHLLVKKISLSNLTAKNIRISLVKSQGITNWNFLFERKSAQAPAEDTAQESHQDNYALMVHRIAGIIFSFFPSSLAIENLKLSGNLDGHFVSFHTHEMKIAGHSFTTSIQVVEDTLRCAYVLKGKLDPSEHTAGFRMFPGNRKQVVLPYLKHALGADIRFDTITFMISESLREDDLAVISGAASIMGLYVSHEKISSVPVQFDRLGIGFTVNVKPDRAELDSSSLVTFNRLDFHPYISYRARPSNQIIVKVNKPEFPAQDLFSSLPEGLFLNLAGIKVSGGLSWHLDFSVDLAIPDSLVFDTDLKRYKFAVLSFGNCDLTKINGPFTYTAYEKGVPVKSFIVGPENPDFRPLERISPFLKLAVLGSEDAGFYQHRGFIPDAFRESFITDIKEKRFARGGSTISMQLVKNVFLNRNKTLSRKIEEVLLVWLLENQGLSTKDRMFEVYLNIIEWGPKIYGINEASLFYFNKDASKLTLSESIFLASIIPRPKWFMYSFDKEGHPGQGTIDFMNLLMGKMLKKEQITQQEYDRFVPSLELKGAARLLLKKADSIPADTLGEDDSGY